jgi:hypothetical protein
MTPEEKIICLIDKLKEEWHLTPKQNSEPIMFQAGLYSYNRKAGEIVISKSRLAALEKSCSIADDTQLQNILAILQQNEVISDFRFPEILSEVLTIQLPEDFEERYKNYREKLYNQIASNETKNSWVKPITRKLENGKLPYKKDGLFYSLWKYANAHRLTGKSLIAFTDLAPLEGNPRFAIFEFLNSLQELKIELESITFHEDIYKKYCGSEYDYIKEYITKNPNADFTKAIIKLFKNQATFDDVYKILGIFDELVKIKLQLNGLLEFIEFSPSPSVKNLRPLNEHLEAYLKCFCEDKLFSPELKNFYRFSRQKEIFLSNIEHKIKDYGAEFVFEQGEIVSVRKGRGLSINKDEAYLFTHISAALEKQELFEIESILITDMDVPPEKQTDDYKVKIMASQKLLDEYEQKIIYLPASTKPYKDKEPTKTEAPSSKISDTLSVQLKDGQLTLNTKSGSVKLNNVEASLNPTGHEFRILYKLMANPNYLATYNDLLDNNPSKVNKRNLAFAIRNLKKILGILPAEQSQNKDCIKNMKGHGYKLT